MHGLRLSRKSLEGVSQSADAQCIMPPEKMYNSVRGILVDCGCRMAILIYFKTIEGNKSSHQTMEKGLVTEKWGGSGKSSGVIKKTSIR